MEVVRIKVQDVSEKDVGKMLEWNHSFLQVWFEIPIPKGRHGMKPLISPNKNKDIKEPQRIQIRNKKPQSGQRTERRSTHHGKLVSRLLEESSWAYHCIILQITRLSLRMIIAFWFSTEQKLVGGDVGYCIMILIIL